jgi:hypothetical protein
MIKILREHFCQSSGRCRNQKNKFQLKTFAQGTKRESFLENKSWEIFFHHNIQYYIFCITKLSLFNTWV